MPKKTKLLIISIFLIVTSYSYGVLSFKYEIFPFRIVRNIYKLILGKEKPQGRWHLRRTPQRSDVSRLAALPYLAGYRHSSRNENVTVYRKGL